MKETIKLGFLILFTVFTLCLNLEKGYCGEYTFQVVNMDKENKENSTDEADIVRQKMASTMEIYQNIKESDTDLTIAQDKLTYNLKREKQLTSEITRLEKELNMLPKLVKKGYLQLKNTFDRIEQSKSDKAWVTFNDTYLEKKTKIETRLSQLKDDLEKVKARKIELNLEIDSLNAMARISNSASNKTSAIDKKNAKVKETKLSLNALVKNVTSYETRELLKQVKCQTIKLCNFDCESCYLCRVLYQ